MKLGEVRKPKDYWATEPTPVKPNNKGLTLSREADSSMQPTTPVIASQFDLLRS